MRISVSDNHLRNQSIESIDLRPLKGRNGTRDPSYLVTPSRTILTQKIQFNIYRLYLYTTSTLYIICPNKFLLGFFFFSFRLLYVNLVKSLFSYKLGSKTYRDYKIRFKK